MGRLIPFDPDGRKTVTEFEIYDIIALLEKIAAAQAKVDRIAAALVDRLKAGAQPEDDCPYRPRLERIQIGGITEERLIIDGVVRWRRIAVSAEALRRNANILATEPS